MQKMSFPQLGGYGLASVGGAPSALPAAAAPPHPPHPPPSSQVRLASLSSIQLFDSFSLLYSRDARNVDQCAM